MEKTFPQCDHDPWHESWFTGQPFCQMDNDYLLNCYNWLRRKHSIRFTKDESRILESAYMIECLDEELAERGVPVGLIWFKFNLGEGDA